MPCLELQETFSRIGNKCLTTLRLRKREKRLEISAPFDFKTGPAMNFPGYSEDDISLMKEKAIASTATTIADGYDGSSGLGLELVRMAQNQTHAARPVSNREIAEYTSGLKGKMVSHVRRVSRGVLV